MGPIVRIYRSHRNIRNQAGPTRLAGHDQFSIIYYDKSKLTVNKSGSKPGISQANKFSRAQANPKTASKTLEANTGPTYDLYKTQVRPVRAG